MIATIDFETTSRADLKAVGVFKYAMDPSTKVLCLAYSLGNDVKLWTPDAPLPQDLIDHARLGGLIEAHNAEFEYCIWNYTLRWGTLQPSQLRDTAARAAALGLPRSLEQLGLALGASILKDTTGKRTMLKLSKPRKPTKNNPSEIHNSPADHAALYVYCKNDVLAEKACAKLMPPLSDEEQKTWELNLLINTRGITCDTTLCKKALTYISEYTQDCTQSLVGLTQGRVDSGKRVAKIREELGGIVPNLRAKTVEDKLKDETLTPYQRNILELRQLLAKSSVAKYESMLNMACLDGKIRGTLLYHGAHTGRWSGRGIQPQNFVSPPNDFDVDALYPLLANSTYVQFKETYPNINTVLSYVLRGMLTASPGTKLIAGDLNAIEARTICWLAGDTENLIVWQSGQDPYKAMAAYLGGIPIDSVTKEQRAFGKKIILACGYQMGAKKFKASCEQENIPITEEKATLAVDAYRNKYAAVVSYWRALFRAALKAIRNPGAYSQVNNVIYYYKHPFLFCTLPSGRRIAYPYPEIAELDGRPELSYMTVNSMTKKWVREKTYGGKLAENVTQATARDILRDALFLVESKGYHTVLTVHDEIVTESEFGSATELKELMESPPLWAKGLPIKAETWEGFRYRK